VRNLGLIVAFWLTALLPINSFALGLGEIEVNSFLNQPLSAEIEVLSARPGEIDDLLVSLASRDAFTRAGLERPRHLSDLRFEVKKNEAGDSAVILVTTRAAVKEPFLNFLVEADWSQGRLLREFTILLDPPFYADQPAPVEPASSAAPAPVADPADSEPPQPYIADVETPSSETGGGGGITEPIALSGGSSSSQGSNPPATSEYVSDESQNIIQGDVLVVKGDTLWSIASRYKDRGHSMAQVMLAFQRTNPNAFNNGNINNMRKGAVLRAPSAAEIDALDKQAAYAEVLLQNGLWDEYVARVTGVAPATGGSTAATQAAGGESATSEGELSLLLPGEGDSSSTGTGDSTEINDLRTKLALAEEELEASRIENKDLESRIADLQARLSKVEELQKMVEIEDDSLAQLQAGQSQDQAAASTGGDSQDNMAEGASGETAGVDDAVSDTIKADEEALLEELLAEEAAAQADELAALQKGDVPDGESETAASGEMVSDDTMAATQGSGDQMMNDEAGATKATPPPAPVIITEPVSTGSGSILDGILPADVADMIPSLDGLLANPIILAAVAGVIVLLLVLVLLKRRKAAQDDEPMMADAGADDLFAGDDEDELTPIQLAEVEDHVQTDIKVPSAEDMPADEVFEEAEEEDQFAATEIVSAADMPEPEAPAAAAGEQDDVLNEVDVYLAYGLYDNAEDLLNSSIADNPERADYRSKLLDTYFATRKVDAFVKEAQNLKSMGDAASAYWDRVQIMGYELAPDNALFSDAKDSGLSAADLEIAKPQEADFDLGANDDDDTNFSSTDFNLGEEDSDVNQGEAGVLESTQEVTSVGGKPSTDNLANDSELSELPDDIGAELEFSMDDDAGDGAGETAEDDDLDLMGDLELDDGDDDMGLADDLDLADADKDEPELSLPGDEDEDDIALDFDSDELGGDDELDLDDALQITPPQEDDAAVDKTAIITPNYQDTEVFRPVNVEDDSAADSSKDDDDEISAIDLGMEDTAMKTSDQHIEETGELLIDTGEDDEEDISIIDFGGDDFDDTGDESVSADDDFELEDDEGEEIRTGTFAPGDFDEPTAAISSLADIDDMDDLMLPDDVDEVSTKLDLARAFIDMGDTEGARGSLEEVMSEGNTEQKAEAKSLLDQI
jgi:pilus assembly protein FimV